MDWWAENGQVLPYDYRSSANEDIAHVTGKYCKLHTWTDDQYFSLLRFKLRRLPVLLNYWS